VVGRFHGAHTQGQYDKLARECEASHPGFETGAYHDRARQPVRRTGHRGLFRRRVFPATRASIPASTIPGSWPSAQRRRGHHQPLPGASINRTATGFKVETARGAVRAGKVIVATNGYTGRSPPGTAAASIPIGSYVIATEEIRARSDGPAVSDQPHPLRHPQAGLLLPAIARPQTGAVRRPRVIVGNRSAQERPEAAPAELVRLFPELAHTRISHSWAGTVAFSFDTLAHCGETDGLFYAMGYCGSGVGMAGYLGARTGRAAAAGSMLSPAPSAASPSRLGRSTPATPGSSPPPWRCSACATGWESEPWPPSVPLAADDCLGLDLDPEIADQIAHQKGRVGGRDWW
jgi:hypothetical protein